MVDEYYWQMRYHILLGFGAYYDSELYEILEEYLKMQERSEVITEYTRVEYELACSILDERQRSHAHWIEPDWDNDDWG